MARLRDGPAGLAVVLECLGCGNLHRLTLQVDDAFVADAACASCGDETWRLRAVEAATLESEPIDRELEQICWQSGYAAGSAATLAQVVEEIREFANQNFPVTRSIIDSLADRIEADMLEHGALDAETPADA